MRGWTKLSVHARSRTNALKTTTVFFSGKFGFSVLPLSLQSAIYSCPCRISRFLQSVATTWTTTTLAYSTKQITNFLAIQPVWCRVWHPDNLLHRSTLRFTTAVDSVFCIIVIYACTCLDHELRMTWVGFCECPHAIKSCLPHVYPWRHAEPGNEARFCLPHSQAVPTSSFWLLAVGKNGEGRHGRICCESLRSSLSLFLHGAWCVHV